MFMKKYLLAVLALGATMMLACTPVIDDNTPETPEVPETPETPETPEVVADYTLSTDVREVMIESYGDYFEVGLNIYDLYIRAAVADEAAGTITIKILNVEYMTELSNKTGEGVFGPAGVNWETGEGLAANTYIDAAEIEDEIVGSGYLEMDVVNESYKVYDGITSGNLTVKKEGENYVIKGILTTLKGKTLKIDYTGAVAFEDYSNVGGGAELLSANKTVKANKYFSSAVKFFKK